MTKKTITCWICKRLHEGSTWAGFAVPLLAWATQVPYPQNYMINAAAALCGMMAVLLKDKP